jgi:hypothetical protein
MGMMVTVAPGYEGHCEYYPHQKWFLFQPGVYADQEGLDYKNSLACSFWDAAHSGTLYTKPIDREDASSLVPILEAQLRAFEYWEPDESKDYE